MNPQQQQQIAQAQALMSQYMTPDQQRGVIDQARILRMQQLSQQAAPGQQQQMQSLHVQQQLAQAQAMQNQYMYQQQMMNFQQTQQMQMARAMQQAQGNPEAQQLLAQAQAVMDQHAAMTPQQQQAMIAQARAQYNADVAAGIYGPQAQQPIGQPGVVPVGQPGVVPVGQPGAVPVGQPGVVPAGQPVYGAVPAYAAPVASSNDASVITISFPDGCIIGWDRLRNELIVNGKVSNTRLRQMPARPSANFSAATGLVDEGPAVPVEKQGMMTKLGWKKDIFGNDSWQPRYFRLTETDISYAKDASSPAIKIIPLNKGVIVNVVDAQTNAYRNRYENKDFGNAHKYVAENIASGRTNCSGPIGRDHCVEMIVTGQVGTAFDAVLNQSTNGLVWGGGLKEMRLTNQGRTYYMSCSSRLEADEWKNAIQNNVRALPEEVYKPGDIGGAKGFAAMNGLKNNMSAMTKTMFDMRDPNKSLEWYKNTLGTRLPNDQVYALLTQFYDDLDRANVPHP